MKKSIITLLTLIVFVYTNHSQIDPDIEKTLKKRKENIKKDSTKNNVGALVNLGFNRVGLYNWAGGGQNSISINGLASFYAYHTKGNSTWDSNLDIAFGVIRTGYGPDVPWFKNDDRIEFNSKFGHKANKNWYYSGLINFRTQFTYGYNTVNERIANNYFSNFFSPAYTIGALGFDYKPNDNFTCFISPGTMKITFVMNDSLSSIGAFGVDEHQKIRSEFGGYFKMSFLKKEPFDIKDLSFKTNLSLFSNYTNQPQNIDVTWETLTSMKVGKFFSLTLSTYLIYDHDIEIARFEQNGVDPIYLTNSDGSVYLDAQGNKIQKTGPITQFKEAMGIGVSMNF